MPKFEPGDVVCIVGPAGVSGKNNDYAGMTGTVIEMSDYSKKNIARFTSDPAQQVNIDGNIVWFLEENLASKSAEQLRKEFLELLGGA